MKYSFSNYLKRLLLYLTPLFFISNQKYSNCIGDSFYDEYPNIQEELNKYCKQDKNICPMIDAIIQSLTSINTYSNTYEKSLGDNNLKYNNVHSSYITCKDVLAEIKDNETEIENNDEKYVISLVNCTSLMKGELKYSDVNYPNFQSELYLYKITIFITKKPLKGEMHILFEYDDMINKTYYYKPESDFEDDEIIKMKLNEIMEEVFQNYIEKLKGIIELEDFQLDSQLKYLDDIINQFAKNYSILVKKKIDLSKNNVSYIAYNELKFDPNNFINIKDNMYIPNLHITFEYALNYNITYNEGSFLLDYLNFSKTQNSKVYVGNIISKYAPFEEILTQAESEENWKRIKTDFSEKFDEYKNNI